MPRPPSKEPKIRVNLELPERTRERIDRLQHLSEAETMTEVIRKAVAVYDALFTTIRSGGKVVLRSADGVERELVL